MGKQRKEHPQDSIFASNPFLDGLFDWMDSPEGQQCIAVRDVLWDLLEDVQLDAKQRTLIWPDAEPLDLEQSIQRIQKEYPDFPRDEVEEFLLDWIDMGYDPENYSQAQLDELDSLTERWVADHLRKKKASKKQKRRHVSLLSTNSNRTSNNTRFRRFVLAERAECGARAKVSPRSGAGLTLGRRVRGPLHDATQTPPVSALKRVQPPSARAEPAGGYCSQGSSSRS